MASSGTVDEQVIWRPVVVLSRQSRRILAEAAAADSSRRMGVYRPSLTIGGTIALVSLLFIGGAVVTAWNMFGLEAVPATPLRVLLTLIVGAVGLLFFVFALRILAKRLFHARYYLYLGDRWLVERNFWHATIIPVSRLEYAWGRREFCTRGADLEYESIAWKGSDGLLRVYDLKDHYWHGKGHGHAAVTSWTLIRRQYGIGGPPASLAGSRRTLTLEED